MAAYFTLMITTDYPSRTAELRLFDANGLQLAYHLADFKILTFSTQLGMFDLHNYLRDYVDKGNEKSSVAEIGVCIAEQVLGAVIFSFLYAGESSRSLCIQLPGVTEISNHLAAALARIPWEIARPAQDKPTLAERNLQVRIVHNLKDLTIKPLSVKLGEELRVLFVFADTRGLRPLASRLECRKLQHLFVSEIYPKRLVKADFLIYGVTRERLIDQIADNGGYHIVHWSGHGNLNRLELAKANGEQEPLSGSELLDLFIKAAGFIPSLFFLSACQSGDIINIRDLNDVFDMAQGKTPEASVNRKDNAITKNILLNLQSGYTGTADALLQGGVTSIVAMRFAVGDDYARDLSVEFYRALFSNEQHKTIAIALTKAQQALKDETKYNLTRYTVCDHATPVLYGTEQNGLILSTGRSSALDTHNPCLHQIPELTEAAHPNFVGRIWELAGLGAEFIGSREGAEVKPVAVIIGLGGIGKTALAAEVITIWQTRFDWLLLYQAKPNHLSFEYFLQDIHLKLQGQEGVYCSHIQKLPDDAIFRDSTDEFNGTERIERLTRNLLSAMQEEAILLVLDNFETNQKTNPENPDLSNPIWACEDPSWDYCLNLLASELIGARSRILITSSRPLAALAGTLHHTVLLGPLAPSEAHLYLRVHEGLNRMIFGGDRAERELAIRLLEASRFHPLLMDRLASLASGGKELRLKLLQALTTLEQSNKYAQLPELFIAKHGDPIEQAYLEDALAISIDQLIVTASRDTRRLLWVIALANEAVTADLLQSVWGGMGAKIPLGGLAYTVKFKVTRPTSDAVELKYAENPNIAPLLSYLFSVGLISKQSCEQDDNNYSLFCHELVRDRFRVWMETHPDEFADLTENSIYLAYAICLTATYEKLQKHSKNFADALDIARRALIYSINAGDHYWLEKLASLFVSNTLNRSSLAILLPHLQAAFESAPPGRSRRYFLVTFADALKGLNHDACLSIYLKAAKESRKAANSAPIETPESFQAWQDVAWITYNWALALRHSGDLNAALQLLIESTEAERNARSPAVRIIGTELEVLRTRIMQGYFEEAFSSQLKIWITQLRTWWRQSCCGQPVQEAPDQNELADIYMPALDIAFSQYFQQQDWTNALSYIEEIINVERYRGLSKINIARDQINHAKVLIKLRRLGDAKIELEECLHVFQHDPLRSALILIGLAELFYEQGDVPQAIKLVRRALVDVNKIDDPAYRAEIHGRLARYLEHQGASTDTAEAPLHQLAALIYRVHAGLGDDIKGSKVYYISAFRRAHAVGVEVIVPRVSELLANPQFYSLANWLSGQQVDFEDLQSQVDKYLEGLKQTALELDLPTEGS